jgi:hypothetical protein
MLAGNAVTNQIVVRLGLLPALLCLRHRPRRGAAQARYLRLHLLGFHPRQILGQPLRDRCRSSWRRAQRLDRDQRLLRIDRRAHALHLRERHVGPRRDPTQHPRILHARTEHIRLCVQREGGYVGDARRCHIIDHHTGRGRVERVRGLPAAQCDAIPDQGCHERACDDQHTPPAQHAPVVAQFHAACSTVPSPRWPLPARVTAMRSVPRQTAIVPVA